MVDKCELDKKGIKDYLLLYKDLYVRMHSVGVHLWREKLCLFLRYEVYWVKRI